MDAHEISEPVLQELLGATTVLPEQFWGARACPLSGERALMWAVLADGIDSYRRNAHPVSVQQQIDFDEAERWLLATDWEWPFSFVNLCEAFGFDPAGVRWALKHWCARSGGFRRQRFRQGALRAA